MTTGLPEPAIESDVRRRPEPVGSGRPIGAPLRVDASRAQEIAQLQQAYDANQGLQSRTGQVSSGTDWLPIALAAAVALALGAVAMGAVRHRRRSTIGHAV